MAVPSHKDKVTKFMIVHELNPSWLLELTSHVVFLLTALKVDTSGFNAKGNKPRGLSA